MSCRIAPDRRILGLLATAVACAAAVGCGKSQQDIDSSMNSFVQDMMVKRTPQQRAIEALQTDNPDERRKLLAKVLKDKQATSEWAVKIFASVAKIDTDPQVRCMAIKGLRRSADERAAEPILMILNHKDFPNKVVPPTDPVRWDATEVLAYMSDFNEIPPEHRDWARRTLIRLVTDDPDRHVRIYAARGLGNYPNRGALTALIRALEDPDFHVRYSAENSLEKLTGYRHNRDPDLWRDWAEKTENPFVKPEEADAQDALTDAPPPKNMWQKTVEGTRNLFLMWQGDAKESPE
ncbi:MAG: HEAT repeat domain-containing protein [Phycisphaerae bacterium]|nr:HEAT repeat domain-containing protein [Phycisphaerae bacterium]